ncbi:MAG TPA: VRR-NUC domain-containing protein [Alcanivorax sp.]|nr:VRR-NUC domain-containing protein [Alcanivorax sp.]
MASIEAQAPAALDDPFYYLHNFQLVLDWVADRHGDLLNDEEHGFVAAFTALPLASRALLVRMIMRKGELFRADKLRYEEVGPVTGTREGAAAPLVERGWLDPRPALDLEALFRLFTKPELGRWFETPLRDAGVVGGRKADWFQALNPAYPEPRRPDEWGIEAPPLFRLTLMPLCDRFRLMFFGNLYQDWSEFVLAELGTFQYEPVAFCQASRPFQHRDEIDAYLRLHECRDQLERGEDLGALAAALPEPVGDNPWLLSRLHRLRYNIARQWERSGELAEAEALYRDCAHPGARGRRLRVLERQGEYQGCLALARDVRQRPESEAERQQLGRLLPRLHRKLSLPAPGIDPPLPVERFDLCLANPAGERVEHRVAAHLLDSEPAASVHYVENTLLTGLFGLLFWEALFAPLPGAFFHPFQSAPADLHWPDFRRRREALFQAGFEALEDGRYADIIVERFLQKYGRLCRFVHWGVLDETLLAQALGCIPAEHLALCFRRLLDDLKENRAGLPDLIRFWPAQRRYQMVEVKGPGDRLQDNQRRWLDFFARHGMPVAVCYVRWD